MGEPPVDLSHELDRDNRFVRRELSSSLMSNTKWRAVIDVLKSPTLSVQQLVVKFVDVEVPQRMEVPWTSAPHAFLDSLSFGPFSIVGIEWVEVPSEAIFTSGGGIPAKRVAQDVVAVRSALEATGKQFPLSDTDAGLRITGHVR
jgi:hypothetical protein